MQSGPSDEFECTGNVLPFSSAIYGQMVDRAVITDSIDVTLASIDLLKTSWDTLPATAAWLLAFEDLGIPGDSSDVVEATTTPSINAVKWNLAIFKRKRSICFSCFGISPSTGKYMVYSQDLL